MSSDPVAIYAAGLSTAHAIAGLVAWINSGRPKIAANLSFHGYPEETVISLSNGSTKPFQATGWSLAYEPKWYAWSSQKYEVTPEREGEAPFAIGSHDRYDLTFQEQTAIDVGEDRFERHHLVVTLHRFGRKRPLKVTVR